MILIFFAIFFSSQKVALGAHLPDLDSARIVNLRAFAVAGNIDSAWELAAKHPPIGKEVWLPELERLFWLVELSKVKPEAALNLEILFQPGNIPIRKKILEEMPCPSDSLDWFMYCRRLTQLGGKVRCKNACSSDGGGSPSDVPK